MQLTTLRTAAEAEARRAHGVAVAGSEMELRDRPPLSLCGGAEVWPRPGLRPRRPAGGRRRRPPRRDAGEPGVPRAPPPTSAAALVRHHAGVLAACAAVQAAAPGAPFFYVAHPALAGLPAAARRP